MNESVSAASSTPLEGGSAAARAYREQLAREGTTLPAFVPGQLGEAGAESAESPNARRDERMKVNGRAQVRMPGTGSASGRMVDISLGGACVLMDDPLRAKTSCMLEIDVFHNGRRHMFTCPAVCIYAVLAAGKGFKVGFQFGARDRAATSALAALLG